MKKIIRNILQAFDSGKFALRSSHLQDKVLLDVPYIADDSGNCGIACAAMIIKFYKGRIETTRESFTSLKTPGNYLEPLGWKHAGLRRIIEQQTSIKMSLFKYKSLAYIKGQLSQGRPVIVSLSVPENLDQHLSYALMEPSETKDRHMVVCIGYDGNDFIVNDPRNIGIYSKGLKVPKKIFNQVFNGNGIV